MLSFRVSCELLPRWVTLAICLCYQCAPSDAHCSHNIVVVENVGVEGGVRGGVVGLMMISGSVAELLATA